MRIPIGVDVDKIEEEYKVNLDEMDENEREFWELNKDDMEVEKLQRKENDSYLEYF
jgi:hypothetical protein